MDQPFLDEPSYGLVPYQTRSLDRIKEEYRLAGLYQSLIQDMTNSLAKDR